MSEIEKLHTKKFENQNIDKDSSFINKPVGTIFKPINIFFSYLFKKIEYFFLWASGIHVKILDDIPFEKSKYFGIGGTIIFTALMASLAGGYAFFTAFKSVSMSVFFGIFWGCLIFNLDRYIVSTFGVGDGKKTISLQEVKEAFPRLLMAILLGIVIATPLELKIFEKEILVEIEKIKIEERNALTSLDTIFYAGLEKQEALIVNIKNDVKLLEKELELVGNPGYLEKRLNEIIDEKKLLNKNYNKEYNNYKKARSDFYFFRNQNPEEYPDYTTTLKKYERKFKRAERKKNLVYNETKEIENKISELKLEINNDVDSKADDLKKKIKLKELKLIKEQKRKDDLDNTEIQLKADNKRISERYDGFAAHLEAMHRLNKESSKINAASWLISLLLIFIEIAPILFKMMTERGAYDDYLDRLKYDAKVRQMQRQSDLNDEVNMEIQANADKMNQQLETEKKANQILLDKIATAQAEINAFAIEEWKKKKLQEIKEDPSKVIKSF